MKVRRTVVAAGVFALFCGVTACSSASTETGGGGTASAAAASGGSQAGQPAGPAGSPAAGTVTLGIGTSRPLVAGLPSVEKLTIDNNADARPDATVELTFHRKPGGPTFVDMKLAWFNPNGSRWVALPVRVSKTSAWDASSSYTTALPSGSSTQELRITTDVAAIDTGVTLTAGGTTLATQHATIPVTGPTIMAQSAPKSVSRHGQAEFDFTLTNPTSATYPQMVVFLNVTCSNRVRACNLPGGNMNQGFKLDWFDGSVWRPLIVAGTSAAPNAYVTFVRSGALPPGTVQLRFRLSFGAGLDARADAGAIQVMAGLPLAGLQGIPPSLAQQSANFAIR